MLSLILAAHALAVPAHVQQGAARDQASATIKLSIPVRLVNKGILPVTVVIEDTQFG
jgi:hypothetical protein